jgi:hypothetical protein
MGILPLHPPKKATNNFSPAWIVTTRKVPHQPCFCNSHGRLKQSPALPPQKYGEQDCCLLCSRYPLLSGTKSHGCVPLNDNSCEAL